MVFGGLCFENICIKQKDCHGTNVDPAQNQSRDALVQRVAQLEMETLIIHRNFTRLQEVTRINWARAVF